MTIQLLPENLISADTRRLRCSAPQPRGERRMEAADSPALPLWLTASEAELLLELCAHSRVSAGEREEELFTKLGDLMRGFR